MNERIVQTIIKKNESGKTLLHFLSERFRYHSLEEWNKLIEAGLVKINGRISEAAATLKERDVVSYDISNFNEPEVSKEFSVAFEDDDFLIVNKSGNLPVHPAGPFFKNTLWWILKKQYEKIHIMTRLDRESSGLVVIAKNPLAAANFAKLNSRGDVRKKYIVVVFGNFPEGRFIASGRLFKKENSIIRKKLCFDGELREIKSDETELKKSHFDLSPDQAVTIFRKLNYIGNFSVIEAELISGRTHQIRAVLSSLNFPVVGDKIYGTDENAYIKFIKGTIDDCDFRKLGAKRQLLHCRELSFLINGSRKILTAEIPDDVIEFCKNRTDRYY